MAFKLVQLLVKMTSLLPSILESSNQHKLDTLLLNKNYSLMLNLSKCSKTSHSDNVLLSIQIKNLTYKNFNTSHILYWHLLIEEFGPEIKYINGPTNVVDGTLSHLNILTDPLDVHLFSIVIGLTRMTSQPDNAFPITYDLLNQEKTKDKTLVAHIKCDSKHYTLDEFHGGGGGGGGGGASPLDCSVTKAKLQYLNECKNGLLPTITIPYVIQESTEQRKPLESTSTGQICKSKSCTMSQLVQCVKSKRNLCKKYGLIPEKQAEYKPWE